MDLFPSPAPPSSQEPPTTYPLRFPWGTRQVAADLVLESFTAREQRYLAWVFRGRGRMAETNANHLLHTALPRSFYPGKLIRAGRKKRVRRGQWPIHGYT